MEKYAFGIVLCVAVGLRCFLYIREVMQTAFTVDDAITGNWY